MKKYLLLLLVSITLNLINAQNPDQTKKNSISLTIKVGEKKGIDTPKEIKSPNGNTAIIDDNDISETSVSIRSFGNLWGDQETFIKNEQNSINITKKVNHNELLQTTLPGGGYSVSFYLEKGGELAVTLQNKQLIIEGESREAKQNRFLQSLVPIRSSLSRYYTELAKNEKILAQGNQVKTSKPIDPNVLFQKLDKMVNDFIATNKDISKSFIQFIEMDTKYFRLKNELKMPNYNVKTYHPFSEQDIAKLEESIKDSSNEEAILSLHYRQVLFAYIDYLRINDPKNLLGDGKDWLANEVKIANYVPNIDIRQFVVAQNLYELHYENGKNPAYIETVSKNAGQWASMIIKEAQGVKGKSTSKKYDAPVEYPVLTGLDKNGNKISLKDFKGQWLYIDLWATWCGPCKFEIPYLEELKHRLKEYNVTFVGISVDKDQDREKLLNLIKKENLGGLQLQNSNVADVYAQLAVMGIPHFAIIAPDGKLYLNKAPKPSSGISERLLKSLAGKK